MLIDSHCHLDYFTADELPAVLARAAAAGVGEMVTIGTRWRSRRSCQALAEAHCRMSGAPSASIRTTPPKRLFLHRKPSPP